MIQEITYTGISSIPSDYDSPDGQLQLALNLIPEDGALRPIPQPVEVLNVGEDTTSVYIHKVITGDHYLLYNQESGVLSWTIGNDAAKTSIGTYPGIKSIDAIGNMLVLLSENPVRYLYWKDTEYIDLGEGPEKIRVRTVVNTTIQTSTQFEQNDNDFYTFNNVIDIDKFNNALQTGGKLYVEEDKEHDLANKIFGLLNQMIAESQKRGVFNYPFFIRYAYRLFDGSRFMYTAPHLVIPTSSGKPILLMNVVSEKIRPLFYLPESSVSFEFAPMDAKWKDLITHVDVFVTPQIPGYISDDKGISEISPLDEEYNDYTAAAARVDGSWQAYRPSLIWMAEDASNNVTPISINSASKWRGYTTSGATYAWMDMKGEPTENFKMYTLLETNGLPQAYNELPIVADDDPIRNELPIGEGFKVYKADIATATSTAQQEEWNNNCSIYISRSGGLKKERVYYTTGAGELDFDRCLSVKLTRQTDDDVIQKSFEDCIVGENPYYLLHSIEYEKLVGTGDAGIRITPDFADGLLNNITVKESIADDYRSADKRIASASYDYNDRMNLNVNGIIPFEGDSFRGMFDYPGWNNSGNEDEVPEDLRYNISDIYFEIVENGTTYLTHVEDENDLVPMVEQYYCAGFLTWLFYPNTNARRVILKDTEGILYAIDLKKHEFLNGAYAFNNFKPLALMVKEINELPVSGIRIPSNKIFTSGVNNPFHFSATNINTVGTGRILALSSATKALSQGQFGQFPLYAFTSEGVWALEVSGTGTYTARQPVTRDIILPAADGTYNVTQMDSAVLFPTQRGIMMLQGSDTVCLTEPLTLQRQEPLFHIPKLPDVIHMAGLTPDLIDLPELIRNARIIYDYAHQRIILYNPQEGRPTAYVLSLRSRQWGQIQYPLRSTVNAYPQDLAINADGQLVDFSQDSPSRPTSAPIETFLLTRPFKLSDPTVLKTIDTLIQRGIFQKEDIQQILYGTTDFLRWYPVWSSNNHILQGFRGTPYKAFRLAVMATLNETHSLSGATVQFNPRMTNKPR